MGGHQTERKSWGEGALKVGMTALYKEGEHVLPLPHADADGRRLSASQEEARHQDPSQFLISDFQLLGQ